MERFIQCPHCNIMVEVVEENCKIFRCGVLKENFEQINPHLPKEQCDELSNQNKIYGCGKPFRIEIHENGKQYVVLVCDYI